MFVFRPQCSATGQHYGPRYVPMLHTSHMSSTGNDQAYRARRFGCREIKVTSAPIFFNTDYRHAVVTNAFFNMLITGNNHYRVCE